MSVTEPMRIRSAIVDCVDVHGKIVFREVADQVSERLEVERDHVKAEMLSMQENGFLYLVDVENGREVRLP